MILKCILIIYLVTTPVNNFKIEINTNRIAKITEPFYNYFAIPNFIERAIAENGPFWNFPLEPIIDLTQYRKSPFYQLDKKIDNFYKVYEKRKNEQETEKVPCFLYQLPNGFPINHCLVFAQ
uniref:Uncharacterized protein n=1 Tax=Parastrongyloides trichosuri TaxID=131310 RepID=A0A0N4ZBV2_PARTI